jgi:hypothetical protein
MPRVMVCEDPGVASLGECTEALLSSGFDPHEEESLAHAALQLRRLGNNPDFLGDLIVAELAAGRGAEAPEQSYGPQVIMLSRPGDGDFFLRANIWPSGDEHMMRSSGAEPFVYHLPHDHNFDFLTLGYFGPGYWSDYYEYDYESVVGWRGEPVELRFVERTSLEQGKLMHYRAHLDVHSQMPADSLSVSLNVMHTGGAQGWLDQYRFDVERGQVTAIISQGASEAFLRIAVGLRGEEALDLAERFCRTHPSDRMRLAAWDALAGAADDADAVWQRAESCGSRLVAAEAVLRRCG